MPIDFNLLDTNRSFGDSVKTLFATLAAEKDRSAQAMQQRNRLAQAAQQNALDRQKQLAISEMQSRTQERGQTINSLEAAFGLEEKGKAREDLNMRSANVLSQQASEFDRTHALEQAKFEFEQEKFKAGHGLNVSRFQHEVGASKFAQGIQLARLQMDSKRLNQALEQSGVNHRLGVLEKMGDVEDADMVRNAHRVLTKVAPILGMERGGERNLLLDRTLNDLVSEGSVPRAALNLKTPQEKEAYVTGLSLAYAGTVEKGLEGGSALAGELIETFTGKPVAKESGRKVPGREALAKQDVKTFVAEPDAEVTRLSQFEGLLDQFLGAADDSMFENLGGVTRLADPFIKAINAIPGIGKLVQKESDAINIMRAANAQMGLKMRPAGVGSMSDPEMAIYLGSAPDRGWSRDAVGAYRQMIVDQRRIASSFSTFSRIMLENGMSGSEIRSKWNQFRKNNPIASRQDERIISNPIYNDTMALQVLALSTAQRQELREQAAALGPDISRADEERLVNQVLRGGR